MIHLLAAAHAQDPGGGDLPFRCDPDPVDGLVVNDTVQIARQRNQQLYGAVGFVERTLFPALENRPSATAFELNTMYGVAYVPTVESGCGDRPAEWSSDAVLHRVDLFSSAVGMAVGKGPVSLWYANAITGHAYASHGLGELRPYGYAATAIGLGYLGPIGPLVIQNQDGSETRSRTIDWFFGADLKLAPILNARVAYVGTTGLYANATGRLVRLAGSIGVRPDASAVPRGSTATRDPLDYLRLGLVDQTVPERAEIGRYSLFARKQVFAPAVPGEVPGAEVDFWTGHLGARSLGLWVDLDLALAAGPTPFVHQAHVGLHTPGFWELRDAIQARPGVVDVDDLDMDALNLGVPLQAGIFGGMTRLPDLYYYGVPSAPRIYWRAEVLTAGGEDTVGVSVGARISYNDADVLAQFPYAYDAMQFSLLVSGGFGEPTAR